MNHASLLPAYPLTEYQLILSPDQALQDRIRKVRQFLSERAGTPASSRKAYVLLSRWMSWDMQEERILQRLRVIALEQYPFRVKLEGYSGFPYHTLIIPVTSREPVLGLIRKVRAHRRLLQSPDHDPFFTKDPYLALARGLSPETYEAAVQALGNRNFAGSFIADGMLLLKRRAGSAGSFQIVCRLAFEYLPVTPSQGELFGMTATSR